MTLQQTSQSPGPDPASRAGGTRESGSAPEALRRAKILIVDDHALVRRGLATRIGDEPDLEVCGEAGDAVEAMTQVGVVRPDLVVVDLSLRNGHGLDLIRQIRARDAGIKMLVLSMHDEKLFAERALRAGALG